MRYAVIMAGGAGTRLWPMSRTGRPKQMLPLISAPGGAVSLLQVAAGRLRGLVEPQNIYICAGESFRESIFRDLPLLSESQFLGEAVGRDTANAIGYSAAVLQKKDPDASMAVVTSDHVIEPVDVFQAAVRRAFEAVEAKPELLLTFGIVPTFAATSYGYLQQGAEVLPGVYLVKTFKEKPAEPLAKEYFADKTFAWNSGMFVWKAKTILGQIQQHFGQAYAGHMEIAAAWGTPQQNKVVSEVYAKLPKGQIDATVMEKAPNVAMIPMPVKWLDVGSWPSYGQVLTADAAGNRTGGSARAHHIDSQNVLAVSEEKGHLIATIGCQDLIIIHTPRATLVCPAKDAERIKQLVAEVEKQQGKEFV